MDRILVWTLASGFALFALGLMQRGSDALWFRPDRLARFEPALDSRLPEPGRELHPA
jgi:hypothetical protein